MTAAVPALLVVGAELTLGADGESRRIVRRAGHESRVILRIEGCSDREAAEAVRGVDLLVARELAPPLGEDEWWAEDLEGCHVHDRGRPVGRVVRLLALPSCEVLEVALDRAGSTEDHLLVPLVGDAIRAVDVRRREIDIDLAFLGQA